MQAKLALEDGTVFTGRGFGAAGETCGEVVFNTSMTGYQEVLDRPVLHRPDRDDDLSAHRQLRHDQRGPGIARNPGGGVHRPRTRSGAQ